MKNGHPALHTRRALWKNNHCARRRGLKGLWKHSPAIATIVALWVCTTTAVQAAPPTVGAYMASDSTVKDTVQTEEAAKRNQDSTEQKSIPSSAAQKTTDEELPDIYEFKPAEKEATYNERELGSLLQYPAIASRNGIEGLVRVRALVGKDGKAKKVVIEKSTNDMFNESATTAVMNMHYTPAVAKGKPINMWITFEIRFELK